MGQEHASIAVAFLLQLGPLAMLLSPFISAASAGEAAMTMAALRKIRPLMVPPLGLKSRVPAKVAGVLRTDATGRRSYHLCPLGAREKVTEASKRLSGDERLRVRVANCSAGARFAALRPVRYAAP